MGPPALTDADRSRLGEIQPAIVAFCSGNSPELVNLGSLFHHGLLRAAVVDRNSERPVPESANQPDRSEESFQTLTAANFPAASASLGAERK